MILTPIPLLFALYAGHAGALAPDRPVSGRCFEARTASVFAGACHYGGEATTAGREALVVWRFESGTHAGVDLAGVAVAAAIAGEKNLAETTAARRSVLYLSDRSTEIERAAAEAFVRGRFAAALGHVVLVRTVPLRVEIDGDRYSARAGECFQIDGEALPDRACCKMPMNVWYRPLTPLVSPIVGRNAVVALSEEILGPPWRRYDENTGFVGALGGAVDGAPAE